MTATKAANL